MKRLNELTVNPNGFVFDPVGGEMFTVNLTGMKILDGLRAQKPVITIALELTRLFAVSLNRAEKDIFDFTCQLKAFHLM
jgi:hypothetical protein